MATRKKCEDGLEVQSLIFSSPPFTVVSARKWAEKHNFYFDRVDITPDTIRLRQEDPENFKPHSFRLIQFGNDTGIKAIVACPN